MPSEYTELELAAGKAAYDHWLSENWKKDASTQKIKPPAFEDLLPQTRDMFVLGAAGAIKWQNRNENPEVDKW